MINGAVDGFTKCNSTEEGNGNKYLIFTSIDKNKQVLTKYTELWDKIKYLCRAIKWLMQFHLSRRIWERFHAN